MVVPNALNLKLPGQSKSKQANQPKFPPSEVIINKNGTYVLNGSPAKKSSIEKAVRDQKKKTKKVSIIVVPHDDAPNESVVGILDIAYRYQVDAIMTDPK